MKIISITGTKGKTTVVFLLDYILRKIGKKTLCINSEGLFSNGRKIKNNEYFLKKYGTSANVAAIREIGEKEASKYDYFLIESSFSILKNLDNSFLKNNIDVGVITNVYSDHIDGKKVKNRKELLLCKTKILENIKKNGKALIFSGNTRKSISHRSVKILKEKKPNILIREYLGGCAKNKLKKKYHICNDYIFLGSKKLLSLEDIGLDFAKIHYPTAANAVALIGIIDLLGLNFRIVAKIKLSEAIVPGRLNIFSSDIKKIVLDYAHEYESLRWASKMLRKKFPKNKILAVVRLSYFKNRDNIVKLSNQIVELFDSFIVYDKAISRKNLRKVFAYDKAPGEVSRIMEGIILKRGKPVVRIDNELKAISYGIKKISKEQVLYIMGDQIEKDIKIIKSNI